MCADPSAPGRGDQATRARGFCAPAAWLVVLAAAACGPGTGPLEAGRILAGRAPIADLPPVPGADGPYPSLGSVPERPMPPPPEQRRRIEEALVADRERARHAGPPLTPPALVAAPPAAPAPPPSPLDAPPANPFATAAPSAEVPGMVGPLASPPPAPPPPIAGAPREARAATEAAAPTPAAIAAAGTAAPIPALPPPAPAGPPATAVPPSPPRPDASVIVDRAALPPPRAAAPLAVPAGAGVALPFPPGSAVLTAEARAIAARFVAARAGAAVRVTGYRDGMGGDLALALARAQAVAQALRAAGLPAEAIELAAEPRPGPAGRGAEIRLLSP